LELLGQTRAVLEALDATTPRAREVIARHVGMTIEGMASTVEAAEEGKVELRSLEELRRYCYIVAGLVGELLTELFLLQTASLSAVAAALRNTARLFGEGLQLTNILKDEGDDAAQGRRFLPRSVDRKTVFGLARDDL